MESRSGTSHFVAVMSRSREMERGEGGESGMYERRKGRGRGRRGGGGREGGGGRGEGTRGRVMSVRWEGSV